MITARVRKANKAIVGRWAKLNRDVVTKGGFVFEKGLVFEIGRTYNGKFEAYLPIWHGDRGGSGQRLGFRGIRRCDFTLLVSANFAKPPASNVDGLKLELLRKQRDRLLAAAEMAEKYLQDSGDGSTDHEETIVALRDAIAKVKRRRAGRGGINGHG